MSNKRFLSRSSMPPGTYKVRFLGCFGSSRGPALLDYDFLIVDGKCAAKGFTISINLGSKTFEDRDREMKKILNLQSDLAGKKLTVDELIPSTNYVGREYLIQVDRDGGRFTSLVSEKEVSND